MSKCDKHLLDALELARRLTILADEGESDAQDDGCAVVYGVIRDCAYRIRQATQKEREAHKVDTIRDESGSEKKGAAK